MAVGPFSFGKWGELPSQLPSKRDMLDFCHGGSEGPLEGGARGRLASLVVSIHVTGLTHPIGDWTHNEPAQGRHWRGSRVSIIDAGCSRFPLDLEDRAPASR